MNNCTTPPNNHQLSRTDGPNGITWYPNIFAAWHALTVATIIYFA